MGASVLVTSVPVAAQEPGTSPSTLEVVPVQVDPSGSVTSPTGEVPDTSGPTSSQTVIEGEEQPARRVATESRRVMAVIAGLVFVALALALLTARYVRITKPSALVASGAAEESAGATSRRESRRSRRSVAGADHAAADDDWEIHATGEHAQVDLKVVGASRPDRAARRRALGLADSS